MERPQRLAATAAVRTLPRGRPRRLSAAASAVLVVGACTMVNSSELVTAPGPPPPEPMPLEDIPDVVPRAEPPSASGNMLEYEQSGGWYRVLDTSRGYDETGVASWYGRQFHGRRTSSGEPFDMYAVSAAHRTLPLPSYVHVTNLDNGRSIIVRVNDRGPFHEPDRRIIDLSYAAAVKIGMAGSGTANVRVRAMEPWQTRVR